MHGIHATRARACSCAPRGAARACERLWLCLPMPRPALLARARRREAKLGRSLECADTRLARCELSFRSLPRHQGNEHVAARVASVLRGEPAVEAWRRRRVQPRAATERAARDASGATDHGGSEQRSLANLIDQSTAANPKRRHAAWPPCATKRLGGTSLRQRLCGASAVGPAQRARAGSGRS